MVFHVARDASLSESEVRWLTDRTRELHELWGSLASSTAALDEAEAEEVYERLASFIRREADNMNCTVHETSPTYRGGTPFYIDELLGDLDIYFDEWKALTESRATLPCFLAGKKLSIVGVEPMVTRRLARWRSRSIVQEVMAPTDVVTYYLYLILFQKDTALGITMGFTNIARFYKDCMLMGQGFGIGLDFSGSRELRLYKHPALVVQAPNKFFIFKKHKYYLADASWGPLYFDRTHGRLRFIFSRGFDHSPFIFWVNFEISPKFRFINIEEPYYQSEPVKPEDLIKAIINNEQTKNSIENAIKELTATLQKLHS